MLMLSKGASGLVQCGRSSASFVGQAILPAAAFSDGSFGHTRVFDPRRPAESRRLEFLHFRMHEVMIWFVSGDGFSRAEPRKEWGFSQIGSASCRERV